MFTEMIPMNGILEENQEQTEHKKVERTALSFPIACARATP